jgi:hypothetical protein
MAVFAMSAVTAASASAAHTWLIGGKLVAAPTTIMSKSTLVLADDKATGGAVVVSCTGFGTGTVGPDALDLISKITAEVLGTKDKINCTFVKVGLCKSGTTPTVLALDLPWHTEIYTEGTETRDMTTSDGAGEPGWDVTCTNILGGTTEDDCKTPLGSTALANAVGGVLATFDNIAPQVNCSVGGAGAGLVSGDTLLESPGAEALTFD